MKYDVVLICLLVIKNCYSITFVIMITYTGLGRDDPLFHTLDNKVYLFMGIGDFLTMDALDENRNVAFSLQGRQDRLYPDASATWSLEIAFGEPNLISFQVSL